MELSVKLKNFIKTQDWTFAKTYADTWPHEYIVQEKVDNELFLALADHLVKHGYEGHFYEMRQTYPCTVKTFRGKLKHTGRDIPEYLITRALRSLLSDDKVRFKGGR